ncbi:MAG: hypothetical protein H5T86_16215 [Armatimonadetes bacterium]|nr:hypothetical protein [Armatimonadota bacterium]
MSVQQNCFGDLTRPTRRGDVITMAHPALFALYCRLIALRRAWMAVTGQRNAVPSDRPYWNVTRLACVAP